MESLILNFLTSSGPMVVYPVAFAVIWVLMKKIQYLEAKIEQLNSSFMEFKLEHERESVKNESILRIEAAIERNNLHATSISAKIFDRLDEINRNGCARIGICRT